MNAAWTPRGRILAALAHREPDRVPFFLPVTLHGARMLGMGVGEFLRRPDLMARAQLTQRARYGHDGLSGATYASAELEAFGGRTIFFDDGPPNGGEPVIRKPSDIDALVPPRIGDCPALVRMLELQTLLRDAAGPEVPVFGVVVAPFSLPILQMGFEAYLDLMEADPARFRRLMAVNQAFCVAWAQAQIKAGAAAVGYFDPAGSSTIVTLAQYRRLNLDLARETLARIPGPSLVHLGSGRCLPHVDVLVEAGAEVLGVGSEEDLGALKRKAGKRAALLGNLGSVEMTAWTPAVAEAKVREALALGGPGGGFVLSDAHGEIPFQVPEAVLDAIGDAVRRWGTYPLAGAPEARP